MKRYGVVDLSTDAGGLEVRLQRVALWCSNHELVVDVAAVTPIDGQDNPGRIATQGVDDQVGLTEQAAIDIGVALARSGPVIKVAQLDAQYGGLDGIQAEVATYDLVIVLGPGTVAAQEARCRRVPHRW